MMTKILLLAFMTALGMVIFKKLVKMFKNVNDYQILSKKQIIRIYLWGFAWGAYISLLIFIATNIL